MILTNIIIYSILSFILLFLFALFSYKFDLVDKPSKRKIHKIATAYTGGMAISITFVISNLIFDINMNNLNLILSIAFLISVVGMIDDKFNLSAGGKLSLQIIPIFYLIIFENLYLIDLGNYNSITIRLGTFSIPFTLVCVLFLINAFNYFDGMDGTLGFTTISVLGILYFLLPDHVFRLYLLIIIIPICIFLFFNFSLFKLPKIFLGDSGSLLLGFIISFILIYLGKRNFIPPILLAWTVVIFVYEFLSINIIRLKKKTNLFKAGKDHLHHILIKKTKSVFFSNLIIISSNTILFIIGYISFNFISPIISLILFIFLFFIFLNIRIKYLV